MMAGRKYSKNYAKFQVSGYATRGGTRFGANEKTYLKKYFFGYVFRSRYVFFLPTKVLKYLILSFRKRQVLRLRELA